MKLEHHLDHWNLGLVFRKCTFADKILIRYCHWLYLSVYVSLSPIIYWCHHCCTPCNYGMVLFQVFSQDFWQMWSLGMLQTTQYRFGGQYCAKWIIQIKPAKYPNRHSALDIRSDFFYYTHVIQVLKPDLWAGESKFTFKKKLILIVLLKYWGNRKLLLKSKENL